MNEIKEEENKLGCCRGTLRAALQRTNTENYKQIFPEKELRGNSRSFHIMCL